MKSIDLVNYFELTDEQRAETNKIILEDLKTAPERVKTFFKQCNNNPEEAMRRTYQGYLAELAVLKHLQSKNPNSNWHFVDPRHGQYILDYKSVLDITNLPDLVDNNLTFVEVKAYTIYSSWAYFCSTRSDLNEIWASVFHSPDYVIIYDPLYHRAACFDKYYFLENTTEVDGNTKGSHSFKIKLRGIKNI